MHPHVAALIAILSAVFVAVLIINADAGPKRDPWKGCREVGEICR